MSLPNASPQYNVSMCTLDDIPSLIAYREQSRYENGLDGNWFAPYATAADWPPPEPTTIREQLSVGIHRPRWKRSWLLTEEPARIVVGELGLRGGSLVSELHRATLSIGILAAHRRQGFGKQLMLAAIEWALLQPTLRWLDLGVFTDNIIAQKMYQQLGFQETGRVEDRFQLGKVCVGDIQMSLDLNALRTNST